MPNVTVTNTNASSVAFLGLGRIASGATKSGYVLEAQYAAHAAHYRANAANVGVVVQEQGADAPTGVESLTATATLADTTKIALVDTTGGAATITFPLAATVGAGWPLTIMLTAGTPDITLDPGGSDTIGGVLSLTTAGEIKRYVSDGVSNWAQV